MQIATYTYVLTIPHYRNMLLPLHSFDMIICAPECPSGKIQHLKKIFIQKYYSASDICKDTSSRKKHICSNTHNLIREDNAPYVPTISDMVSVFLMRFNINVDVPANKSAYLLRLDRDYLGLEAYMYMYIHTVNRTVSSSTSS